MTEPPIVTVCLPVSRDATVVKRALSSVLAQDLGDFEVLIGDETGAGEAVVNDLADQRVDYRRNPERLGFAANHCALLDRARGRYLAVLHDDDWWEPTYLSSLVAVLDAEPTAGMACCGTVVDRGAAGVEPWPVPLTPGRHDNIIDILLREEWFLLPISTMWRREAWTGPARQWPDLCCGDLQVFLSIADAGWGLFYLPTPLAHWVQHDEQSGAWRGPDNGLRVADDVLTFWDLWLGGRSAATSDLVSRQRARWHLRRARALLLSGNRSEARVALGRASALARAGAVDPSELPQLRTLSLAARLPTSLVRAGVAAKRSSLVQSRLRAGRVFRTCS
jgi:glycosyltransferase involved in cell wall biosynthesis